MIRSAGVIPVRFGENGPEFLLLRVFRYWDFPKGEVERGEEPLATACREVLEETGLGDLAFNWGGDFYETPPYGRQAKVARYYLAQAGTAEVRLGINPELGAPEHHEFRWVGVERARNLLNPRVAAALDWAVERMATATGPSGETPSGPPR
jgi:8-oxo-dGTP pyrophosphatase MutT (NUDIX family)